MSSEREMEIEIENCLLNISKPKTHSSQPIAEVTWEREIVPTLVIKVII